MSKLPELNKMEEYNILLWLWKFFHPSNPFDYRGCAFSNSHRRQFIIKQERLLCSFDDNVATDKTDKGCMPHFPDMSL